MTIEFKAYVMNRKNIVLMAKLPLTKSSLSGQFKEEAVI